MTTIGFIGSGNIGGQLARAAVASGYDVVLSNSRAPETLAGLVAEIGDGLAPGRVRAGTVDDAASDGDIVVVTVPLAAIETIPAAPLAGKVVLDTNNYYWERDGRIPALDSGSTTVSELLQSRLPASKVVKAFNNIVAASITTDGLPAGTPNRRALSIAGDDDTAKATVRAIMEEFGFDVVDAGPLSEGWRAERDMPAYVTRQNAEELRQNLGSAERTSNR